MVWLQWTPEQGYTPVEMEIDCKDGGDWNEARRAAGYRSYERFGYEEDIFHCITVYIHDDPAAPWQYYLEISLGDGWQSVFVRDFPNIMAFLLHHAPLIQATASLRILEILSRAEDKVLSEDRGILGHLVWEKERAFEERRQRNLSFRNRRAADTPKEP